MSSEDEIILKKDENQEKKRKHDDSEKTGKLSKEERKTLKAQKKAEKEELLASVPKVDEDGAFPIFYLCNICVLHHALHCPCLSILANVAIRLNRSYIHRPTNQKNDETSQERTCTRPYRSRREG